MRNVTPPAAPQAEQDRRAHILTKATIRAADHFGLKSAELARVLGVSDSTVTRMRKGTYLLQAETKSFELAQLFLRLYRSLDSITGGDDKSSASWLRSENVVLGAVPATLIQSIIGLMAVADYLDSRRGTV